MLEHHVEALRELADLVVGVNRQATGQVVGLADLLRCLRNLGQRREHPPRSEPAERRRQGDPAEAQQHEDQPQLGEDVVDAVQGARELERGGLELALHRYRDGEYQHPQVASTDVDVAHVRAGRVARDRQGVRVDRQRHVALHLHLFAAGEHELDVWRGAAGARGDRRHALVQGRDVPLLNRGRLRSQRVVHLPNQLVPHDDVGHDRGDQHSDGDRRGGGKSDSPAQRHPANLDQSRRMYPTPRTVCSRRGSPPASVLRRR